jgi:hypothetical protein
VASPLSPSIPPTPPSSSSFPLHRTLPPLAAPVCERASVVGSADSLDPAAGGPKPLECGVTPTDTVCDRCKSCKATQFV